jgi:hypothetical protein
VVSIPLIFRKEMPHKSNVFVYTKFMAGVGIFGIIVFDTINILSVCLTDDSLADKIGYTLVFQTFNLLGVYLILAGFNLKVELYKEEMIYTNFLRISKKYNYHDIEKVVFDYFKNSKKVEKAAIYYKKRKTIIDCYFIDFDELVGILRRKIKQNRNCIVIEKNKKETNPC